jgi:hypothetical protein
MVHLQSRIRRQLGLSSTTLNLLRANGEQSLFRPAAGTGISLQVMASSGVAARNACRAIPAGAAEML